MSDDTSVPLDRVSHYRLLHRLGSGGIGDVYAGLDETLQRRVALKSIRAEHRLNAISQARFLREARILSQLDHPNICRAYDYIQGDQSDWLVLEQIDGRSLKEALKEGPIGPTATTIAEQIAAVLVVTHAAGVVHRDLKPGNVMITPSGHVKVLDFGIARSLVPGGPDSPQAALAVLDALSTADVEATRTSQTPASTGADSGETQFQTLGNSTLGTLVYMSPEQARGEAATAASDMFSFGLLLYEVLTGRRAYPDELDSAALVEHVQNARIAPLSGVSSDLVDLVRRLTSFAPTQRPTALETVERLRWIREAPKRRLRRILAAAAIAVVALASLKYTVDLRRERTAALRAEADANRRRGQAEDLIGFMLGDLRDKLQKAGRLELLDGVGAQAMTYFASVPAASLTGEELSRRVQAVYQIGDVRLQQGNLKAATAAFEESLALATALAARDPANADWQLRLATAHFYVGDARRRQNDLDGAMRELTAYRDIAERLVARDSANMTWALELSYGHGGVAAIQEAQGDFAGARRALELALSVKESIAARDPKAIRQHDLAVAHNRLGVVLGKLGETDAALRHYQADLEIRRAMVERDPRDQSIKRTYFVAIDTVGGAREDAGDLKGALEQYQTALEVTSALAASDTTNADWQRDLAISERRLADIFSLTGRPVEARSRYQRALTILRPIAAAAPTSLPRQRDLARVELGLGVVELSRGATAAAREAGAAVERLLAPFAQKPDSEWARVLAEARLLSADLAVRARDTAGARRLRESALDVTRSVAGIREKRLRGTEARVLIALDRVDEARPIVADLLRLGYRHPLLVEAWRAKGQPVDTP